MKKMKDRLDSFQLKNLEKLSGFECYEFRKNISPSTEQFGSVLTSLESPYQIIN